MLHFLSSICTVVIPPRPIADRLVRFAGTEQVIESTIGFRPNLPNGATFIVLGQHVRSC
jgi:hypothetical protein